MLFDFYGLREQPFGVTPDPRYLYASAVHREALASLIGGIESGTGFSALIAEPGMGKTTLLFDLLNAYRKVAPTAFLFHTQCDSRELLGHIAEEFQICANPENLVKLHSELKQFLVRNASLHPVLLIIDEAQNLRHSVLETVRLLSDFETPERKLLHIILAGQTRLANHLMSANVVQLRQRLTTVARLHPLSAEETARYIEHRLRVGGYTGATLFSADALERIREHSRGIPRLINCICFNAMLIGCSLRCPSIRAEVVEEVVSDLDLSSISAKAMASIAIQQQLAITSQREAAEDKQAALAISSLVQPPRPSLSSEAPVASLTTTTSVAKVQSGTSSRSVPKAKQSELTNAPLQRSQEVMHPEAQPGAMPPVAAQRLTIARAQAMAASKSESESQFPPAPGSRRPEPKTAFWARLTRPAGAKAVAVMLIMALVGAGVAFLSYLKPWTYAWVRSLPLASAVHRSPAVPSASTFTTPDHATPHQRSTSSGASEHISGESAINSALIRRSRRPDAPSISSSYKPVARDAGSGTTTANIHSISSELSPLAIGLEGAVGGDLVSASLPVYPREALAAGVEGSVQLAIDVSPKGDVIAVHTVAGDARLAKAAAEAIQRWRYRPFYVHGNATAVQLNVTMEFRLPSQGSPSLGTSIEGKHE